MGDTCLARSMLLVALWIASLETDVLSSLNYLSSH